MEINNIAIQYSTTTRQQQPTTTKQQNGTEERACVFTDSIAHFDKMLAEDKCLFPVSETAEEIWPHSHVSRQYEWLRLT